MRLEPSDPDIETVVMRIERGDLDLQPSFQRGEVWSKAKKQRLIDSILRDWHIPPIHVIELRESRRQEVLDGQQRLAAIRDFVRGDFVVDGNIEPHDPDIAQLSGKRFRDLPDGWKRRFNQFTLRIFRIVDYRPEEPGELFFRLNQPTSLTAAEQRNAFFGPVRGQIKKLVALLDEYRIGKGIFGFSNSRMAYDDVLARICLTVQRHSLAEKVTATDLVELYRTEKPLPHTTIDQIESAIELFGSVSSMLSELVQLNKATVHSWFLYVIRAHAVSRARLDGELFASFMKWFEQVRLVGQEFTDGALFTGELLRVYEDRSTSRVADVSSVILRDAIIWLGFESFLKAAKEEQSFPLRLVQMERVYEALWSIGSPFEDDAFARGLVANGWGRLP